MKREALIEAKEIKKSFRRDKQDLLVLDNLSFTVYQNEIVAVLGKSGAGKSTMLRIVSGLTEPNSGMVKVCGNLVKGPVQEMTMVFQNFALMPWLTVMQNVELGLEAMGISREERVKRALKAIDVVGLDGFESAYPKELSAGMCQRVGFARAIVVEPKVLLMDESFSALDILTADNLRTDLLALWQEKKTKLEAIFMVTHNIEEAAMLADRIFIFGANPGSITAEIRVDLPHPRRDQSAEFQDLMDKIYTAMTAPTLEQSMTSACFKVVGLGFRLPKVSISELSGFMEALAAQDQPETVELHELADDLQLGVDDLFPITETLEILRFAKVSEGDIELTAAGREFAQGNIQEQKALFAMHLMRYVPLARHIRRILDERPDHMAKEERFLRELEDYLSEEVAEEVLSTVIDWARYAEIFAFDYNAGKLSLEDPS